MFPTEASEQGGRQNIKNGGAFHFLWKRICSKFQFEMQYVKWQCSMWNDNAFVCLNMMMFVYRFQGGPWHLKGVGLSTVWTFAALALRNGCPSSFRCPTSLGGSLCPISIGLEQGFPRIWCRYPGTWERFLACLASFVPRAIAVLETAHHGRAVWGYADLGSLKRGLQVVWKWFSYLACLLYTVQVSLAHIKVVSITAW